MKIHNLEQGTPEWFEVRKWKMTASHATAIASAGKWLQTYAYSIVASMFSSGEKEYHSNKDTDRWHELEPMARWTYEMHTWNDVLEVWFIELDESTGCSPDWLVWDDWLVEIKSFNDEKYVKLRHEKKIDTGHVRQMQMQMYVCDRQRCDYVAYNPNFKETLFIKRVERDEKAIEKIKIWIETWKNLILISSQSM